MVVPPAPALMSGIGAPLTAALISLAGFLVVWWMRERRLAAQRRALHALYQLSEEVFSAAAPAEILRRLRARLPGILGAGHVSLYLHNRLARILEPVAIDGHESEPVVADDATAGSKGAGVATCFRNQTLLTALESKAGPLAAGFDSDRPEAVLFVPMLARGEILGVLEVGVRRAFRHPKPDQRAAMQHLGNQIAISLQLQEQQTIREQLFRSEKLAAAGKLISGLAGELGGPLRAIEERARHLLEQEPAPAVAAGLKAVAAEAARASEMVSHLVSFSREEQGRAKVLDLNGMLNRLIRLRRQDWRALGVELEKRPGQERIWVAGAESQLEQAFLDLLVQAEQSMATDPVSGIRISTSALGRWAVVQITFAVATPAEVEVTEPLQVATGIILSHGGELRSSAPGAGRCRFEVLLPLASEAQAPKTEGGERLPARRLTALVVEPDASCRKEVVRLLAERKHRVVPVSSAEEGLDLVERLKFDIALCSVRLPGSNWVEFYERCRRRVEAFLLMSEGYDEDLGRAFQGGRGLVLRKPVAEADLDQLLETVAGWRESGGAKP